MPQKSVTLNDIAALLSVPLPPGAPGARALAGVATLAEATPQDVSFLASESYLKDFAATKAAAVIVHNRVKLPPDASNPPTPPLLAVDDTELAVAKVLRLFAPRVPAPGIGADPGARVAPTAELAPEAAVGPFAVVGERCRIGHSSVIHAGVVLSDDVVIGDGCVLFPNVVVRERVTIGNRVIIHAGAVIGSDGFGYRWNGQQHEKIPQIGTVVIEDDVEIGSCVCIDRAKFSTTRVGRGTKIDNLVQVGHNVQIGPHCILVGQSGVAGSATLGSNVTLGGQSAVRDHLTMGDNSTLAACSGVMEDVPPKTVVSGLPALPHRQSLREQAALRHLPELREQVRKLQSELDELRKALGK